MLSKEQIIKDMLAVLAELQAVYSESKNRFAVSDLQVRVYNALCNKLEVYCNILSDDIPSEYIEQIEEFITI